MRTEAIAAALLFAVAGCGRSSHTGNLQVRTTSAVVSSMSAHKTYAFEAIAPAPPGDAQWAGASEVIAEVKQHIDADLQSKGYVLSDDPELVVRIEVGVRKTTIEPRGTLQSLGEPEREETVTDLAIDVFDRPSGGHLFHGSASSQLHHREPGDNKLAKAVRLILERVPPAAR